MLNDTIAAISTALQDGAISIIRISGEQAIEIADRLFDRMLTAKAAGSKTDYLLDRAELLAQLRHLPELQRPNIRNLF